MRISRHQPTGLKPVAAGMASVVNVIANSNLASRFRAARGRPLELAVASCLRMPVPECRRILRANRRFLSAVEQRRNNPQSAASLQHYLQSFECPQLAAFTQLCETDPRSRLIATFHFGDFVYGMNYLMSQDPTARRTLVLVKEASCRAYFDNMRRAFGARAARPQDQRLVDRVSVATLCTELRKQPVNLITFCDLPEHFGASRCLPFLGRSALFPRGLATLAIRSELPVLPVINYFDGGVNKVYLAPQLEPRRYRNQGASRAMQCLTRDLIRLLELFVRRRPEQWRYLSILPARLQRTVRGDESAESRRG